MTWRAVSSRPYRSDSVGVARASVELRQDMRQRQEVGQRLAASGWGLHENVAALHDKSAQGLVLHGGQARDADSLDSRLGFLRDKIAGRREGSCENAM